MFFRREAERHDQGLVAIPEVKKKRGAAALQDAVQPARSVDLFDVAQRGGVQGDEQRGDVLHGKDARP